MFKQSSKIIIYVLIFVMILVVNLANSQPGTENFENMLGKVSLNTPLASGQSKFLGCAYSNAQARYFTDYWNQVTPENAGKWGSVEGARDVMNWSGLDVAYNLAKDNGFPFRFHVLIWGNQQPRWIESLSPTEQLEEIEEWFAAVAERYPDIDYLEVVNEPLHDPPNQPGSGGGNYINALGGSNDLYGTGWDWVIKAFELARLYFPDSTRLMINEFSIVNESSATTTYLQIIALLMEKNLIDGIGVQGHAFSTRGSTATMASNLDRLAETGLPIQVCEMDIDGPSDEIQLNDYKRIFPTFWEHPAVEGITLWGWRRGCWRDSQGAYLVDDRGAERPALKWLRTYIISPKAPKLVSPDNFETDVPRDPILSWQPSDSATSYSVQLSTNGTFTSIVLDSAVTATFLQIPMLAANKRYYWRVNAANDKGISEFSAYRRFTTGERFTAIVNEFTKLPAVCTLFQNYPNPFNPTTQIEFSIDRTTKVTLRIFDLLGREIQILINEVKSPGQYIVVFNGQKLTSGIYFYNLEAGSYSETKKLILLE